MASHPAPPRNPNYSATVVELHTFVTLPNCDNVKAALIFGYSVIIAKDTAPGALGLFFPAETQLAKEFLSENCLFRKAESGNVDSSRRGFFEEHGRVRTMKFRGHKSEGFWIPLQALNYLPKLPSLAVGDSFDTIEGKEICRKYVPRSAESRSGANPSKLRQAHLEDSIVAGQFRLHFDTENLRRNIHKISPNDLISITDKWHGTSVVIAKLLVSRQLNFFERWLQRFGVPLQVSGPGLIYSSRRVIKSVNGIQKRAPEYYTSDIWGEVAREVEDRISAGFTVYGEIVGFTADGAAIQQGYDYGCQPRTHRLLVYRVTVTTLGGTVVELPYLQLVEFCNERGFECLPCLYHGRAADLSAIPLNEHWHRNFLAALEGLYTADADCPHNCKGTPAEGVVLRIDRLHQAENYKLKNFRFLERETKALDRGELDTETAQSESV